MKKINIGCSSFERLITNGNLYVDKTGYLYDLLTCGSSYFFCSRPRRFGKTLTLNTLEAIFKGKRELFRGLAIDSLVYDWKEYPVIHIDFGNFPATNPKALEEYISENLDDIASANNVELGPALYATKLRRLISALSQKAPVVVLIDEYDKILSSNIYKPEVEEMRDVLRGFFEVLKACSDYIRFVFITGVTKYSKVSIFSSMNNLNDISMDEPYSAMFGYTQEELESNFAPYIEKGMQETGMDRSAYLARLKEKYDGYRFTPKARTVYNPVSIGSFFGKGGTEFDNYWIETGGSQLIMNLARHTRFNIATDLEEPVLKSVVTSSDIIEMATGDVTPLKYKSLLLQSGYLTIKSADESGKKLYLGFPNEEVQEAFSTRLLFTYAGNEAGNRFLPEELIGPFERDDVHGAMGVLSSIYASVPYHLVAKGGEAIYHAMFYCMLKAVGAEINSEVATSRGRIDAVLKTKESIYVIEFKVDKSADEALSQIKGKGYAERYQAWMDENPERKIHLLGISFDSSKRNIVEWKEEVLPFTDSPASNCRC